MSDYQVAKQTGINRSTFSDWKSGRSEPKKDKLQKLANFFGVTVEELITGTESLEDGLSYDERKILALFKKMNASGKSEAIRRLSEMTKLSEYTKKGEESSSSRVG